MRLQGLLDLPTDAVHGVPGRHRFLEHRADASPSHGSERRAGHGEQVVVAEQHLPADQHVRRVQPQHRLGRDRLAGAGLPDECEHAPASYVEVDAVHDLPRALPVGEGNRQPADPQESRFGHFAIETRR